MRDDECQEALGLARLRLAGEYRTGEADLVGDFYRPCLEAARYYDRAVGYFRSTVLLVISEALIGFARCGGKIRLVCSPVLAEEDVEAFRSTEQCHESATAELLEQQLRDLLADPTTKRRTEALATLMKVGVLELRLARRPQNWGLYHEKLGIFRDEVGNCVTFKGSANETLKAWHQYGNLESFEVFCSWHGGTDSFRVDRHAEYFERLWDGTIPNVETVSLPRAIHERLYEIARNSLDDICLEPGTRCSPPWRPLEHQIQAVAAWNSHGKRGVFQHATGSGKTITALMALKEHLQKGLPALIVVPSRLLLRQWESEIAAALGKIPVLIAGDSHSKWRQRYRLASMTAADPSLGQRLVLATMQTACTDEFRQRLSTGDHLMVVADEVHQTGSPDHRNLFQIQSGPRLGLSATPNRYGDPVGTQLLFEYFGDVVPPIITLSDAMAAGRLVPYEYHPHCVHLTADEAEGWRELTDKISLEVARSPRNDRGESTLSEHAKLLLIKRSRIAKKAHAKIHLATSVLQEHFASEQRWLIYCEDGEQLREVKDQLAEDGFDAREYHTAMAGDPDATLDWFKRYGGILLAIRCLDEGVDIPEISHALILASSQNPRQFIQRRGRVLRKAPDKYLAVIHDAIVAPLDLENEPEQAALLKSELLRSLEFSECAMNRSASVELHRVAADLGITIGEFLTTGFEAEQE